MVTLCLHINQAAMLKSGQQIAADLSGLCIEGLWTECEIVWTGGSQSMTPANPFIAPGNNWLTFASQTTWKKHTEDLWPGGLSVTADVGWALLLPHCRHVASRSRTGRLAGGLPSQSSWQTCLERLPGSWRCWCWPSAGPSSPCPPSWAWSPPGWRRRSPWRPPLGWQWGGPLQEAQEESSKVTLNIVTWFSPVFLNLWFLT